MQPVCGIALGRLPTTVLYDKFQDAATVLTGSYLQRHREAVSPDGAAGWWARVITLREQVAAVDPDDRPDLITHIERWRREAQAGLTVNAARDGSQFGADLLHQMFDRDVWPFVLAGHQPSRSPLLVLVGGQPAAGKTHATAKLRRSYADADLVVVTGDVLRPFHPHYPRLLTTDPFALPNATGPVVAAWVRGCIDNAQTGSFSLLLEGSFRDAAAVTDTIRRFAMAGYRTEVATLAVRQERSRLDSLLRYLGPGGSFPARWTPPSAHDVAYAQLPNTLQRLEQLAELDRITVWTRASMTVFGSQRGPHGRRDQRDCASHALLRERERPLGEIEAQQWLDLYRQIFAMTTQPITLDPRALPTYAALYLDADRVADMAYPDPADPQRRHHLAVQREAAATLARHGHPPASAPHAD